MMSSNTNTKTQGFKKKTSNLNIDTNKEKTVDKFGDLKSKLQKEKQIMRKTGKRFRQDNSISTQQISIDTNSDKIQTGNSNVEKHQVSIGPEQPIKQTISLKDISLNDFATKNDTMQSSKLFEKQVIHQKKKSNQLSNFLKTIELQSFAESLINLGYDDLQALSEINTESLNLIMMRANQQIRLLQTIKAYKVKKGEKPKIQQKQQFNNTSTLWRLKTQHQQYADEKVRKMHTSQILARVKTEQSTGARAQCGLKPGSFLYTVGSRNWSVQDQIRRACSVCFKVEQQMQRKGDCFYCSNCYKYVSEDLLHISLDTNMNRSYKKLDKQ